MNARDGVHIFCRGLTVLTDSLERRIGKYLECFCEGGVKCLKEKTKGFVRVHQHNHLILGLRREGPVIWLMFLLRSRERGMLTYLTILRMHTTNSINLRNNRPTAELTSAEKLDIIATTESWVDLENPHFFKV